MNKKKKHILVSFIIALIAGAFIFTLNKGLDFNPKDIPAVIINKQAADFRVEWLEGRSHLKNAAERHFSLADFKGTPLVLNFWASWCYSCREEAQELEKFWQLHKAQKDVFVVGVSIQDERKAAEEFVRFYHKTFIIGLDVDGDLPINYGVSGVPETFFIDANGIIKYKVAGPLNMERLISLSAKYLGIK